jgi:hypothetical protein
MGNDMHCKAPYMDEIIGKKVQIHLYEYRTLGELLPFQGPFLTHVVGYDDFGIWIEPEEFLQQKQEGDTLVEYPTRLAVRWNLIKAIVFIGAARVRTGEKEKK